MVNRGARGSLAIMAGGFDPERFVGPGFRPPPPKLSESHPRGQKLERSTSVQKYAKENLIQSYNDEKSFLIVYDDVPTIEMVLRNFFFSIL